MKVTRRILIRGYLVPLALTGSIAAVLAAGWLAFASERDLRAERYRRFSADRAAIIAAAPRLPALQDTLIEAAALLLPDQYAATAEVLKAVETQVAAESVRRTAYREEEVAGEIFGSNVGGAQLAVVWSGQFAPIQQLALRLEAARPNLLLASMQIAGLANADRERVEVRQTYLALKAQLTGQLSAPITLP